jgi:DNA-binding PadR family transcriptional regulator
LWPFAWKFHRRRGLRMWILSMLARTPKNGAEIMDAIEEMSQGWWRPSPGSIYPLLEELLREGLIQKKDDGRYELTAKTREEVDWLPGMGGTRPQGVQEMLHEMEGFASYLEDLGKTGKVQPYKDTIRKIAQRLQSVAEGGETSA